VIAAGTVAGKYRHEEAVMKSKKNANETPDVPAEGAGVVPQPVVPTQVFGADDRLGGAPPEAPEGFVPTYAVDPDAKMADAVELDAPADAPEGYVKPYRPVAMTSVAHYPQSNTV
jgi:hypothetical protein